MDSNIIFAAVLTCLSINQWLPIGTPHWVTEGISKVVNFLPICCLFYFTEQVMNVMQSMILLKKTIRAGKCNAKGDTFLENFRKAFFNLG